MTHIQPRYRKAKDGSHKHNSTVHRLKTMNMVTVKYEIDK